MLVGAAAARRRGEREERRVGLGGGVAAVVAAVSHAVVAEHEQQRALERALVVQQARNVLDHGVHLRQLGSHLRVVRAVPATLERMRETLQKTVEADVHAFGRLVLLELLMD